MSRARRMARRVWEVDGTRIGILCNDRDNAEPIAREAARYYTERHQCELVRVEHKVAPRMPLEEGEARRLGEGCDFLILSVGDSEESATRLIEDAIACEQFGTPVLAVITKPYKALVDAIATRYGILNYPAIAVDDPVHGIGPDRITELGLLVYRQGWATLTGVYRMTV